MSIEDVGSSPQLETAPLLSQHVMHTHSTHLQKAEQLLTTHAARCSKLWHALWALAV